MSTLEVPPNYALKLTGGPCKLWPARSLTQRYYGNEDPVTARKFFACLFRLDETDQYVLWYSNDADGLVRDAGRIVRFSSLEALHAYASAQGLTLQTGEPTIYDWDRIQRWCDRPVAAEIAPDPFLTAWNMLVDSRRPASTAGIFAQAHQRLWELYDKLFRANNLPAMTPPGSEYWPTWTQSEVTNLAQVLRLGLEELRRQLDNLGAV